MAKKRDHRFESRAAGSRWSLRRIGIPPWVAATVLGLTVIFGVLLYMWGRGSISRIPAPNNIELPGQ